MTCKECGVHNPDGYIYCGRCGACLGKDLRREIDTAVSTRFRDQTVVEVETAAAIMTWLVAWAKLFALIIIVPLLIAIGALGILGINIYREQFGELSTRSATIQAQYDRITSELNEAALQLDAINGYIVNLRVQQRELSEDIASSLALQRLLIANIGRTQEALQALNVDALIERVQILSQEVTAIQDAMNTEPPSDSD
jgi:hypothetical protein